MAPLVVNDSPVTLLLASGDTDDFLAANNVLGNLDQDGSDGTNISNACSDGNGKPTRQLRKPRTHAQP